MTKRLGKIFLIFLILLLLLVPFPNIGDVYEDIIKWILSFGGWAKIFILALIISIFCD